MKNTIAKTLLSVNPIEFYRHKLNLSQKQFAAALGYNNTRTYCHHCQTFSQAILTKIQEKYETDLHKAVIKHLLFVNSELSNNHSCSTNRSATAMQESSLSDRVG